MPRRIWRVLDHWWIFIPLMLIYVALWALPASLWFQSRIVTISGSVVGTAPIVLEDRKIRFSFYGRYKTVTRNAATHDSTSCEAQADFPYRGGLDGVRTMDLVEWTDDDPACAALPPGDYYTQTCRTVLRPVWGILPPKTTCGTSNVFTVRE